MRKKYYIYCDMDGVLADFDAEPHALKRFAVESDFFRNLKPISSNIQALNKLLSNGSVAVRILSASPNKNADRAKKEWLKIYLPNLKKKNIIIMRIGQNKKDFIKTQNGILFDDYIKNIEEWGMSACLISAYKNIDYYLKRLDLV